jgi:hypothetical protein
MLASGDSILAFVPTNATLSWVGWAAWPCQFCGGSDAYANVVQLVKREGYYIHGVIIRSSFWVRWHCGLVNSINMCSIHQQTRCLQCIYYRYLCVMWLLGRMWDMQNVTSQCKKHFKRPHRDRYIVELLPQMQVKGGQFVSFVKFIHMYCEAKCVGGSWTMLTSTITGIAHLSVFNLCWSHQGTTVFSIFWSCCWGDHPLDLTKFGYK